MSDIPDDIMQAARECVAGIIQAAEPNAVELVAAIRSSRYDDVYEAEIIGTALAILAERERCAKVALLEDAVAKCERFFRVSMPKMNIGNSCLDAEAISAWNEAECAIARTAIRGGSHE